MFMLRAQDDVEETYVSGAMEVGKSYKFIVKVMMIHNPPNTKPTKLICLR